MEKEILEKETKKWLQKLEQEMKKLDAKNITDKNVQNEIKNIEAYISDCKHFLKQKDLIRAFEAIVYGWGIYDALRRCELIDAGPHDDFV